MDVERRQQLGLRAIQVTALSALRGQGAEQTQRILARTTTLLDQARREATTLALVSDIDAFQRDLAREFGAEAAETSR